MESKKFLEPIKVNSLHTLKLNKLPKPINHATPDSKDEAMGLARIFFSDK